ncbi:MAG: hypothetical protein KDA22_16670 [Phycisphaerales bacterium]|nr:hypothetical protein [Phycisphaerales bacterium]
MPSRSSLLPRTVSVDSPGRSAALATAALVCLLASACASSSSGAKDGIPEGTVPMVRDLRVRDHDGGTNHRILVRDGYWYQTFSNQLLAIDPRSTRAAAQIDITPFGKGGPATDLAFARGRLWVVLARTGLAEFDLAEPREPRLVALHTPESLGILPRRVSVVGDDLYVSGATGVVRWSDRRVFLPGQGPCGSVVGSTRGPVTCIGRDIVRLDDGAFVGSAIEVVELPAAPAPSAARYIFARQAASGAQIGLLDADLREVASAAVPGALRSLRTFDGRLWTVSDTEITSFAIANDTLTDEQPFRVRGARDVAPLAPNILAVSGTFGRAMYRIEPEGTEPGDTFFNAHREASGLSKAISDRRRVLAGGDEGNWIYLIGDRAELTDRALDFTTVPARTATTSWGSAAIGKDDHGVRVLANGVETLYVPEGDPLIGCVRDIDGDLWIGHEFGIDVVGQGPDGTTRIGSVQFEGLVRWLFPKWDGGGVFVSEFGGFGTVEFVERPMTPEEIAAANQAAQERAARAAAQQKEKSK